MNNSLCHFDSKSIPMYLKDQKSEKLGFQSVSPFNLIPLNKVHWNKLPSEITSKYTKY